MNVGGNGRPNLLGTGLRQDSVGWLVKRPRHRVGARCVVEVGATSNGVRGNGGRGNGYRCLGCNRGWTCWKTRIDVLNREWQLLVVHLACHDNKFHQGTLLDVKQGIHLLYLIKGKTCGKMLSDVHRTWNPYLHLIDWKLYLPFFRKMLFLIKSPASLQT